MFSIFKKEFNSFLNSLIAYLVITVFLTFIGLFTWVFPNSSVLNFGYANMDTLFQFGPLALLLLIPAITMRTFSEEKKEGTIELLLTRPLSDWDIVLGKYFSSLALVVLSLVPTFIYYLTIYELGNPAGNIDSAAVFSSYIGLILLGAVFTSIGILSSALTKSQVVAFILCLIVCYFLYDGISQIASIDLWASFTSWISYFGLTYHYDSLSRGVIDSRDILYFLSIIFSMLLITHVVLGSRRW